MTLLPNEVEHGMICGALDSPNDVILRILKEHADNISKGTKNHEFRRYRLEEEVKRVWLYVDEDKTIQYVLTIGTPKTVGQINDTNGIGNVDFNQGRKVSPFGYPIHTVHKLPYALTVDELYYNYGINMITKGKQYVRDSLVDDFPLETLECIVPK